MSRLRRAPSSPLPGGEVWVNERAQRLLRPLTPSSFIVRGPDFNQRTMLGGNLSEVTQECYRSGLNPGCLEVGLQRIESVKRTPEFPSELGKRVFDSWRNLVVRPLL